MADKLSHFDAEGQAHMVDVSNKPVTDRIATAEAFIQMAPATLALIQEGRAGKGDVLGIARVAGIMASKKTAQLIPLCHPLPITKVAVDLTVYDMVKAVQKDMVIGGLRVTLKDGGKSGRFEG